MKTKAQWIAKLSRKLFVLRTQQGGAGTYEAGEVVDLAVRIAEKLEEKNAAPWQQDEEEEEEEPIPPDLEDVYGEPNPPYKQTTPTIPLVFAEPVSGSQGGWLVTLACGHKIATRKKQTEYHCRVCDKTTKPEPEDPSKWGEVEMERLRTAHDINPHCRSQGWMAVTMEAQRIATERAPEDLRRQCATAAAELREVREKLIKAQEKIVTLKTYIIGLEKGADMAKQQGVGHGKGVDPPF